jgi:hypothetical protein
VASYEREFSAVVAEEDYQQELNDGTRRHLRSDYLLVRPPGATDLLPFRDVFEVDGVPVRDRQQRLQRLFLDASPAAIEEARRIHEESARFNIGDVFRTVNLPTLPLMFLSRSKQPRFDFRKHGTDTIEGVATWRLDYRELQLPTLFRTRDGDDVPASGSVWLDPVSGRVVKTEVVTTQVTKAGARIRMETTVGYRMNAVLGIWVPVEMHETYEKGRAPHSPASWVKATAVYSNFRRFQVITEERIK